MPQHAKRIKVRRKDLRKPDEFETLTGQALDWADEHRSLVGGIAGTVVLVALIYLRLDGRQLTIDARPSDAISLALRTKSPIYVAKKVLEASSVLQQMEEGKDQDLSNVSRDKWAEILEKMSPDDFKYKM